MNGSIVEFKSNGGTAKGYLSLPASKKGKAVILLQEWWGLVPHIKDVADRLAKEGFVVLAPDLYHGEATTNPTDAQKLAMAMEISQVEKDVRGCVQYLLSSEYTTTKHVGIVGFCMGGALSLYSACLNEQISACIVFYGIRKDVENSFDKLKAKVIGFFGELDKGIPVERVREVEKKLKVLNKDNSFTVYPGANHAFFNDTRPAYHEEAAKDAWKKTLDFFNKNVI
jgi:carboxymethylenebutenolidase